MSTLQKPKSDLRTIFNAFAAKAVKDFPALKGRLVMYAAPTNSIHGNPASKETAIEQAFMMKERIEEAKNGLAFSLKTADHDLLTFIRKNEQSPDSTVLRTLEHELGHLVVPEGYNTELGHSVTFRECLADSFSLLRTHQQLTEDDRQWDKTVAWSRSMQLALGGITSHFTTPVLKEIKEILTQHSCAELSPMQTVNIAYRAALQFTPSDDQLARWTEAFAPLRTNPQAPLEDQLIQCINIMFTNHGDETTAIFNIGKTLLEPFLNNRSEILTQNWRDLVVSNNFKLEGKFWDEIRDRIKLCDSFLQNQPAQIQKRKLDHMQVMGLFDLPIEGIIDPKQYETAETQADIKEKRQVYEQTQHAQKPRPTSPKA